MYAKTKKIFARILYIKKLHKKGIIFMENLEEKKYYKDKVTELMEKIENPWIFEQILQFILNITKED